MWPKIGTKDNGKNDPCMYLSAKFRIKLFRYYLRQTDVAVETQSPNVVDTSAVHSYMGIADFYQNLS